jgi:hypothetical protein
MSNIGIDCSFGRHIHVPDEAVIEFAEIHLRSMLFHANLGRPSI